MGMIGRPATPQQRKQVAIAESLRMLANRLEQTAFRDVVLEAERPFSGEHRTLDGGTNEGEAAVETWTLRITHE